MASVRDALLCVFTAWAIELRPLRVVKANSWWRREVKTWICGSKLGVQVSEDLFTGRRSEFSSVSALSVSGHDSSEGQVRECGKCWCPTSKISNSKLHVIACNSL